MKQLLLLLFVIGSITVTSQSYTPKSSKNSQDIPKNANTAIIENTSLDRIVRTLIDSGFVIKKLDKEYQFVETEYQLLCRDCMPQIQLYARVKDSTAILTGKWRSSLNMLLGNSARKEEDAMIFEVKNEKQKVPRMAFNKMKNIAATVGNARFELRK